MSAFCSFYVREVLWLMDLIKKLCIAVAYWVTPFSKMAVHISMCLPAPASRNLSSKKKMPQTKWSEFVWDFGWKKAESAGQWAQLIVGLPWVRFRTRLQHQVALPLLPRPPSPNQASRSPLKIHLVISSSMLPNVQPLSQLRSWFRQGMAEMFFVRVLYFKLTPLVT